jgi:hypothetical protein
MPSPQRDSSSSTRNRATALSTTKCPRFLLPGQGFPDPAVRTRGPGYRTRTLEERWSFMQERPSRPSTSQATLTTRETDTAEVKGLQSYGLYESQCSKEFSHMKPTLDLHSENSFFKMSKSDGKDTAQHRRKSLVVSNCKVITSTPIKQNQQEVVDAIRDRYRHQPIHLSKRNRRQISQSVAAVNLKRTPGSANDFVTEMVEAEGQRGGINELLGRLQHWQKLQKDFVGHAPDQGVFSAHGFRRARTGARHIRACAIEREMDVEAVRALGFRCGSSGGEVDSDCGIDKL